MLQTSKLSHTLGGSIQEFSGIVLVRLELVPVLNGYDLKLDIYIHQLILVLDT